VDLFSCSHRVSKKWARCGKWLADNMPMRVNKELIDGEGNQLHWVQCSTVGCRKWHRLNYEPAAGSPFACNFLGGDSAGCRQNFKGKDGEFEDEYWERHPDDEVEVVDEDAIVVGAEETIGEKKAYIEKFKALLSVNSSSSPPRTSTPSKRNPSCIILRRSRSRNAQAFARGGPIKSRGSLMPNSLIISRRTRSNPSWSGIMSRCARR
jgi:hypothetical protein